MLFLVVLNCCGEFQDLHVVLFVLSCLVCSVCQVVSSCSRLFSLSLILLVCLDRIVLLRLFLGCFRCF